VSTRTSFSLLLVLLFLLCASCAPSPPGVVGARAAAPAQIIARPLEVYQQLGFIAGPPEFPVVASLATLAGPNDSTYVLVGMSLPNSALRFQRDSSGFMAQYEIGVSFFRDSVLVKRMHRKEEVHVASYAETGRTDESVIFQDLIALAPGQYYVQMQGADGFSSRGFRARDTVDVPAYTRDIRLSTPVLVYSAGGRQTPEARPDFVVNARKTVPYGAEVPHVYVELYGTQSPQEVELRVVDDGGRTVWQQSTMVSEGDNRLRYALIDVPAALPLGRLWLEASTASTSAELIRTPLLVTISDQWMVANFEDVLRFVNYIAPPAEVDSLRAASGAERRERWERFWASRDPLPATKLNEYREEFFNRVRFATEHYSEPGHAGWDTNRGEVYIVLGPPDYVTNKRIGRDAGVQPNAIEWYYAKAGGSRLQLLFLDRGGFGHYQLSAQSEQAFRAAAMRARPRQGSH
jgi:GWxTD domain-containing protein